MKNLAPIVIFTYTRLETLKKTIKYLRLNKLSKYSNLYIFSDNFKSEIDRPDVTSVRAYIKKIRGFKKIKIVLRKKNYGLSKNITLAVGSIIRKYGKIIVLEDDIIVSANFLDYMNKALNKFKSNKKVWHINSWNYDFGKLDSQSNTYFTRLMNCWGWGTWSDRWKHYNKNIKILNNFSSQDIFRFNMNNKINYWSQILRNKSGAINTWAVFWYANIFKKEGLCLSPTSSLSKNIGFDNLSENQPNEYNSFENIDKNFFIKKKVNFFFPYNIKKNKIFFNKIIFKNYLIKKKSILSRIIVKLLNIISFSSYTSAYVFSRFLLMSHYESNSINEFKIKSLKNQKYINLTNSPSFNLLYNTIFVFKKEYGRMPNRILDVGGGLGENIILLKKKYKIKLNCTIFENKKLVEILKKNNLKHCKFLSNEKDILEAGKFDIIFCSASLEYINQPYRLLKI